MTIRKLPPLDEEELQDLKKAGIFVGGVLAIVIILMFFMGCATCDPIIEYQEVRVEIPVEDVGEPLPVPEPVQCDPPAGEGWRPAAVALKNCVDRLFLKLEEFQHVIESYNESREPDTD